MTQCFKQLFRSENEGDIFQASFKHTNRHKTVLIRDDRNIMDLIRSYTDWHRAANLKYKLRSSKPPNNQKKPSTRNHRIEGLSSFQLSFSPYRKKRMDTNAQLPHYLFNPSMKSRSIKLPRQFTISKHR